MNLADPVAPAAPVVQRQRALRVTAVVGVTAVLGQLAPASTESAVVEDREDPAAQVDPGGQPEPEETVAQPVMVAPAETVAAETPTPHQVNSVGREAQVDSVALADTPVTAMETVVLRATAEPQVTVAMATTESPVPL